MLVQGTAQVDYSDLDANRERYWRESGEKLPATKEMHPPSFLRGQFSWYYTRIYVYVRPERVFVWRDGDFSKDPTLYGTHVEEVRSHHSAEPRDAAARAGGRRARVGRPAWTSSARRHETAVLTARRPRRLPVLAAAADPSPTEAAHRVRLRRAAGLAARPRPARHA